MVGDGRRVPLHAALGVCLPHCNADYCMAYSNQSTDAQERTSCAVYESSPDVGSSRNSTRGSVIMAMPMFVRFAWQLGSAVMSALTIAHCQYFGPALLHMMSLYTSACNDRRMAIAN